ncbi:MAG: exodeoxyribonuclease III [Candidatus Thermoplasmatota archaeon]|nr:exodeoxyribonuclease III [Candidatus Thermoplasmatota archaeon]
MKLISWNINGIRAAYKKGLYEWLIKEKPDILCVQEIKALPDQIPTILKNNPEYFVYINSANRKGYSGVATFAKQKPKNVITNFGIDKFDIEGRIMITEFSNFVLFNIYFPNGKKNQERLNYKLDFYNAFLSYTDNIKIKGKNIIVCGDFNTAHKEIDLSRPKQNEKNSGFLPIERLWIDTFIEHGNVDTFRYFNKEPNQYTWWDQKTRSRERNIGWRIDYFFINNGLIPNLSKSFILPEIMGSDHCPIGITLRD